MLTLCQALSLMERWQPMDSQGALELLTSRFSHPMVKKYAIYQLEQADNEVDHTINNASVFQMYLFCFSGITAVFVTAGTSITL